MFSDFQNIFKKGSDNNNATSHDYAKTPQKFKIDARQIQQKKLLAEGAFGFIWLAEDINTKEQFALKRVICMTSESINSAMIEKNLLEKLPSSPHIIKYHGGLVLKQGSRTVIVTLMELCSGGNLFDLLEKRQGKGIPEGTIKNIAQAVLKALVVLHKQGITHRDIKIQNVLIGNKNTLKICDFGSCTYELINFATISPTDYQDIKERIEAFTTPMYRPPEIVDPYLKYEVSNKADLWMLGCTLFTMSYFVHPFLDSNSVGISNAVFRFPQYPSQTQYNVSDKMKDFIRNLLTPNPSFRPSAEKMLNLLSKWDEFQTIPLNKDAKRLKIEHEQKEQQRKKFGKKIVDHDGDIPMEQLMKIQEKLKNKGQQTFEREETSFIQKKNPSTISKNNSTVKNTTNNKKPDNNPKSPIKNNTATMNIDLWKDPFSNNNNVSSKESDKFDQFSNFFPKSNNSTSQNPPPSSSITKNSDNFNQFFTPSSTQDNTKKKKQQPKQTNLLDI